VRNLEIEQMCNQVERVLLERRAAKRTWARGGDHVLPALPEPAMAPGAPLPPRVRPAPGRLGAAWSALLRGRTGRRDVARDRA
jgi:hypothetical protein